MSKRAWDAVGAILCVLFLSRMMLSVYFVTTAFNATHSGPIKWDSGREAVRELVHSLLNKGGKDDE